jgi:hypothetical protein
MKRLIPFFVVLVGFVVTIPTTGAATCVQSDLAGTWVVYVNSSDGAAGWQKMNLIIKSTGAVAASASGVGSDGKTFAITGGKLTLPGTCTGSGKLNITPSNKPQMSVTLTQFTLQGVAPKNVFTGVGIDDTLTPFTFTGIKKQ